MTVHCFVDADHAGEKVTRRSQTGILIFRNRAPIIAYSKRHNSVECLTYGSKLCAMRQANELIKSLRNQLRMFGIPVNSPADIFDNNESVFQQYFYSHFNTVEEATQYLIPFLQIICCCWHCAYCERGDSHQLSRCIHQNPGQDQEVSFCENKKWWEVVFLF
jgi:hypothetical protein